MSCLKLVYLESGRSRSEKVEVSCACVLFVSAAVGARQSPRSASESPLEVHFQHARRLDLTDRGLVPGSDMRWRQSRAFRAAKDSLVIPMHLMTADLRSSASYRTSRRG